MLEEKLELFLSVPKQQVCRFLAVAVSLSAPPEISSHGEKLGRSPNISCCLKVCFIFQSRAKSGITLVGPEVHVFFFHF